MKSGKVGEEKKNSEVIYQDAQDVLLNSVSDVQSVKTVLSPIETMRIEVAGRICNLLGFKNEIQIKVATQLKKSSYVDNAFKNSYWYDIKN